MAKTLKDKTDTVLNYICKKTQHTNDWVVVKNREFPSLFKISQMYASKILEIIKENPNILYEVDEDYPTRFKPYKFKWTENKQEKIDKGLTAGQFFWLTDEEIDYIKDKVQYDSYEDMSRIIKICNLISGDGGKEWWIELDHEELSDLTITSVKIINKSINMLIKKNILIKSSFYELYKLVLDHKNISKTKKESLQENVETKPKQTRKKGNVVEIGNGTKESENFITNTENGSRILKESIECNLTKDFSPIKEIEDPIYIESKNAIVKAKSVIESAQITEQVITNSIKQFQDQIEQLSQLRAKEEVTEKSYDSFIRLNNELKEKNDKLKQAEEKIRLLEKEVKLVDDYVESFTENTKIRSEILLGKIINVIEEQDIYVQNESLIKDRMKKLIWETTNEELGAIINYKKETKFAPNE